MHFIIAVLMLLVLCKILWGRHTIVTLAERQAIRARKSADRKIALLCLPVGLLIIVFLKAIA